MFKIAVMTIAFGLSLSLGTGARAALETNVDEATSVDLPSVVLTFPDEVDARRSEVRIFTSSGQEILVGGLSTTSAGTELVIPVRQQLVPGIYEIIWKAVSTDGRITSGVNELQVPNRVSTRPVADSHWPQ